MGVDKYFDILDSEVAECDFTDAYMNTIAKPTEGTSNEFLFSLRSLKPGETSWIGASILLKPRTDKIVIKYHNSLKKIRWAFDWNAEL